MAAVETGRNLGNASIRGAIGRARASASDFYTPGIGQALQAGAKIVDAFAQERAQQEDLEAEVEYTKLVGGLDRDQRERIANIQPGAKGFLEGESSTFEDSINPWLEKLPKRLKDKYAVRVEKTREGFNDRAFGAEEQERTRYQGTLVDDGLQDIEKSIYQDPDNAKTLREHGARIIQQSTLSPVEKQKRLDEWNEKSQELGEISKIERDPNYARKFLPRHYKGKVKPRGHVGKLIQDASARHGVDPGIALAIGQIESGLNPAARAKTSSAGGVFQFIDSTARQYGIRNKFNAEENVDAGVRFTRDNINRFRADFDREPTPGDVYLAHFLGYGGAKKFFGASAGASAAKIAGAAATKANKSILAGKTVAQVRAWANRKMSKAAKQAAGIEFSDTAQSFIPDDLPSDIGLGGYSRLRKAASSVVEQQRREQLQAAKQVASQQEAEFKKSYEDLLFRVASGEAGKTEIDSFRDENGSMSFSEYDKAQTELDQFKKRQKEEQEASLLLRDDLVPNPFDKDYRKAADRAYDAAAASDEADDADAVAERIVEKTGVTPKRYVDRVRSGLISDSPATVSETLKSASKIMTASDYAFKGRDGGAGIIKDVDRYSRLLRLGFSEKDAAQKIIDSKSPEAKRERDQFMKSDVAKKAIKSIDASTVGDIFDDGILRGDADVGRNEVEQAAIVAEYREIFTEMLADTGNEEEAKALADKQFKRLYGETDMQWNGGTVVRLPPEKTYPAVEGKHEYIKKQAIEDLRLTGVEVDPESSALLPTKETDADYAKGRVPRYVLQYKDENGLVQQVQDFFVADVATEAKRVQKVRQREFIKAREATLVDREILKAADKAYEETVGPDWMKARARENVILRSQTEGVTAGDHAAAVNSEPGAFEELLGE